MPQGGDTERPVAVSMLDEQGAWDKHWCGDRRQAWPGESTAGGGRGRAAE